MNESTFDDFGDAPICPLCGRPIPKDAKQSRHHLIPKLKGGSSGPTVLLHQICHSAIHAHLTETQLAQEYSSVEKLLTHPEIAAFVAWVKKKDPHFHAPTRGRRRGRKLR